MFTEYCVYHNININLHINKYTYNVSHIYNITNTKITLKNKFRNITNIHWTIELKIMY